MRPGARETHGPWSARRGELRLPLGRLHPARAFVAPHLAARLRLLARLLVLLRRREVVVGVAARDQRVRRVAMAIEPLRLEVGGVGSADFRSFVPVEPEPSQALENAGDHLVGRALGIGVLDAQDEHAAVAAHEQPVEQRRAGTAHMEIAGGGGSEAEADHVRLQATGCGLQGATGRGKIVP